MLIRTNESVTPYLLSASTGLKAKVGNGWGAFFPGKVRRFLKRAPIKSHYSSAQEFITATKNVITHTPHQIKQVWPGLERGANVASNVETIPKKVGWFKRLKTRYPVGVPVAVGAASDAGIGLGAGYVGAHSANKKNKKRLEKMAESYSRSVDIGKVTLAAGPAFIGTLGFRRKKQEQRGEKKPLGKFGHLLRLPLFPEYHIGRMIAAETGKTAQQKQYNLADKAQTVSRWSRKPMLVGLATAAGGFGLAKLHEKMHPNVPHNAAELQNMLSQYLTAQQREDLNKHVQAEYGLFSKGTEVAVKKSLLRRVATHPFTVGAVGGIVAKKAIVDPALDKWAMHRLQSRGQ